jgi:protein arginine kinase
MQMKGKSKSPLHPIYSLPSPWEEKTHNVWLASTLSLTRNFAKYKFPGKLDKGRQHQIITLVYDALKNYAELPNTTLFRSEEIGPLEKEFLLEHYLNLEDFHQAHGGEGFIVDPKGLFLGTINLRNHLHLQLMDLDQEIEKSWNRLIRIEEAVGKSLEFAYNSRFGFLTNYPSNSGTGLVITLFLHIPAIIHMGELAEILEKEKEEEVMAAGIQGSPTEMIGDILVARNACTLGVTEEYIITSLRMWATRAVVAEVTLRKKLKSGDNEHIKNKVARALGLLTHSYQLETIEALNAFSLVKLGIELEWIKGPPNLNLNQIFFNCRRAHLMHQLENEVTIPELPRKRAEYLQHISSQLTLAF